jgi:hypothetical protein
MYTYLSTREDTISTKQTKPDYKGLSRPSLLLWYGARLSGEYVAKR